MTAWLRIQIRWLLVCVLTATALAQTSVPSPGPQFAEERLLAKATETPDQNAPASPTQTPAPPTQPPAKVKKKGGKAKWIVIGAVAGAAVVIGAIFAARLNNEGYF